MYSPKIRKDYIPILYKIAKSENIPMTHLVNEIISDYLNSRYKKLNKLPVPNQIKD
jgi:hypothetical protein